MYNRNGKWKAPKGYCFVSTFMNNKMPAWQYIDFIYNKLKMNNNVYFSKKHKNWVINNDAGGSEVLDLINQAKYLIKDEFNIDIELEVDLI